MNAWLSRLAVPLLLALTTANTASGASLKVVGGSAIEPVMKLIIPEFERTSGHRIVYDFNAAIGQMVARVEHGETADVVIVSGAQVSALEQAGRVTKGSRTDLAKVGVGIFVRKGAPRPDIGSVEAFKNAMLRAKSIGYNDPAAGAPVSLYLIGLFEKLGIASEMKRKTIVFKERSERFGAVARGDVEIGFNQISEIVAVPEVDLVGPLPREIQNYTLFSAGLVNDTKDPEASRSFVRYVSSANVQSIWKEKGFEAP